MLKARLHFDGDNVGIEKLAREYSLTQDVEDKLNSIPEVIDNVTTDSGTDALSARMGMRLQEQIDNLASRGRFLSVWNAATGLPETDPLESPYIYRAGDYYLVGNVSSGTNYRPHGSSYTSGVASQTVEPENISANDLYIYDGTQWGLQGSGGTQSITWGSISGTLSNQTDLQNALDEKLNFGDNLAFNDTTTVLVGRGVHSPGGDSCGHWVTIDPKGEVFTHNATTGGYNETTLGNGEIEILHSVSSTSTDYTVTIDHEKLTANDGINTQIYSFLGSNRIATLNDITAHTIPELHTSNVYYDLINTTPGTYKLVDSGKYLGCDNLIPSGIGYVQKPTGGDYTTGGNGILYFKGQYDWTYIEGGTIIRADFRYSQSGTGNDAYEFLRISPMAGWQAPAGAYRGQLWYDTNSGGGLKVYDVNNNWTLVGGGGGTYSAGNGISIDANNEISVDTTVVATQTDLASKADTADIELKVFTLSSTSDVTTGAEIVAWCNSGKIAVIKYGDDCYYLDDIFRGEYTFKCPPSLTAANTSLFTITIVDNSGTITISGPTASGYTPVTTTGDHSLFGRIDFTNYSPTVPSKTTAATNTGNALATEAQVYLKADASDVLTKNNTTSYTPSGDYNPATKKYVDDSISGIVIPTYTAGNGIDIDANNEISVDTTDLNGNGLDVDSNGKLAVDVTDFVDTTKYLSIDNNGMVGVDVDSLGAGLAGNGLNYDSTYDNINVDPTSFVDTTKYLSVDNNGLIGVDNSSLGLSFAGNGLNYNSTYDNLEVDTSTLITSGGYLDTDSNGYLEVDKDSLGQALAGNGLDYNSSTGAIDIDTTTVATQTDIANFFDKTSDDADDIDDTNSTNKFVTATEKSTWDGKQDELIAGTNIQIAADGKTISATDTTYVAGTGLTLNGTTFNVDTTTIATKADIANLSSFEVVATLPSASSAGTHTIYLLGPIGTGADKYEEWIVTDQPVNTTYTGEPVGSGNFDYSPLQLVLSSSTTLTYVSSTGTGARGFCLESAPYYGYFESGIVGPSDGWYEYNGNTWDFVDSTSITVNSGTYRLDCGPADYDFDTIVISAGTEKTWTKIGETSVDLTNYFNTSTQDSDAITEGSTNLFLTSSERNILSDTSGVNTGDQSASDFDIKDLTDSTGLRIEWSKKQDALTAGSNIQIAQDGTISATDTIYNAGEGIEIGTVQDYSAMQGPAPRGFHVPLSSEWVAVKNIWTALGGGSSDGINFGIALKLPLAGYRGYSNANVYDQGTSGRYWSSSQDSYDGNNAYYLALKSSTLYANSSFFWTFGHSVRCFKNSPVVPTSSWTKLYGTSIESGGIFWSSTDGLISLSSDGQTWITIADKNLGATTVWNNGDTLSEANCGKYYQRGNNYGFPRASDATITTSSTQVDASNYGPGNYYSSSTYIGYRGAWDATVNGNLWGGETGVVTLNNAITNTGVLSVNGQTGDVTIQTGGTYTAGDGIDIDANNEISVDVTDIIGTGLTEDASNNIVIDTTVVATQTDISGVIKQGVNTVTDDVQLNRSSEEKIKIGRTGDDIGVTLFEGNVNNARKTEYWNGGIDYQTARMGSPKSYTFDDNTTGIVRKQDLGDYLAKNNTTSFTPSGDYNPATKKYVDDIKPTSGAGAPSSTPTFVGQQYVDTTNDKMYVATGTSSSSDWMEVGAGSGDMLYADFNWASKTGATVTLDLNSTITPSANFTVNAPSTIKDGQMYVLRVTQGATAYTMTLGTNVTNPYGESLTMSAYTVNQFSFLAVGGNLELQPSVTVGESGAKIFYANTGDTGHEISDIGGELETWLNATGQTDDYDTFKDAVLVYDGVTYNRRNTFYTDSGYKYIYFISRSPNVQNNNNGTSKGYYSLVRFKFSYSSGWFYEHDYSTSYVTTTTQSFLRTDYDYPTPYTPLYNGSPATKAYVDSRISSIPTYTAGNGISIDANNEISASVYRALQPGTASTIKIWLGSQTDYDNLSSYDSGTLYFTTSS